MPGADREAAGALPEQLLASLRRGGMRVCRSDVRCRQAAAAGAAALSRRALYGRLARLRRRSLSQRRRSRRRARIVDRPSILIGFLTLKAPVADPAEDLVGTV